MPDSLQKWIERERENLTDVHAARCTLRECDCAYRLVELAVIEAAEKLFKDASVNHWHSLESALDSLRKQVTNGK